MDPLYRDTPDLSDVSTPDRCSFSSLHWEKLPAAIKNDPSLSSFEETFPGNKLCRYRYCEEISFLSSYLLLINGFIRLNKIVPEIDKFILIKPCVGPMCCHSDDNDACTPIAFQCNTIAFWNTEITSEHICYR